MAGLLTGACQNQSAESTKNPSETGSKSLAFAKDNGGITLPDGFKAVVVADDLGQARHIAVRDNGDVYVALREPKDGGGIVAMRDNDGDGKADVIKHFGQEGGTGIGIHNGYLYFAPDTAVYRYKLREGELLPEQQKEVVVRGFPLKHQHAVKPFTFDGNGNMYVNVGAPSNSCQEEDRTPGSMGMDPCPILEDFGGIWRFDDSTLGQVKQGSQNRYATGLRNSVALDWNSNADNLYVVMHGRDQLHQLFPDKFTQEESVKLPAEEFFKVDEGDNFGWPYAYYDQTKGKKVLAPEYGGDGEEVGRASQFEDPIVAFPGHWAPDDLLFYEGDQFPSKYKHGAFIAWHGSWNRAPADQAGYKVTYVPFEGAQPSGDPETFADKFAGDEHLKSPGNAAHRPTGLAMGPDGSLYVTSDASGRIWRIVYTGQ